MEKKTYIITSAQFNARPHLPFLRSLRHYANLNDAELLIIPMAGRSHQDDWLHPELQKHNIIDGKIKLNRRIQVERYHVRPQQIDPSTGVGRFSASDISTIFESSKQRMKVIPNSVENLPKVLMTTGAVTHPHYNMNNRIGMIAEKDHVYGAIVVEVENANKFHYRQLRGNTRGHFVDLGERFYPDGRTKFIGAEALTPGDWHTDDTNKKVRKATFEMLDVFKPKMLFLHDFFNAYSVSHHDEGKGITRAIKHRDKKMSLEQELLQCAKELAAINEAHEGRQIFIVKSNHDEHLDRFIEEGRYLTHTQNLYVGTKLAAEMVDGKDPLVAGIERHMVIPDNIRFLTRTDEIKVWGYLMSAHGDRGASGSRGTTRGMENAYGKSVSGHPHTPEIWRDTWKVGTSTNLSLKYSEGYPSSWMNTHAVTYDGGTNQLVNIIEGEWRKRK